MALDAFVMGGRSILAPVFFPSVSSIKTNLRPSEYVRLMVALGESRFLASAYDLDADDDEENTAMNAALRAAVAGGCSVLLDSGNYERFWRRDASWTTTRYAGVVASQTPPLAFAFDELEPVDDPERAAAEVVAGVERDQSSASGTTICPIVHGRTLEALITVAATVAGRLQPVLLAVAERELGDGIVARTGAVRQLRGALDAVAPETALHVLGTGSPIALLAYAAAGGQSFDGLEWCQTCVDPDTAHLHHFQHRELVRSMEPSITDALPYTPATLAHNLLYLRTWMARVREAVANGTARLLLESVLPAPRRDAVLQALGLA